jgi:hypothetical protein
MIKSVMPVKAGIQKEDMAARLRGHDDWNLGHSYMELNLALDSSSGLGS